MPPGPTPTALQAGWKHVLSGPVVAFPVSGGFSGARIWQITTSGHQYALRQWPVPGPNLSRLQELHRLLAFVNSPGLAPQCVPIPTHTGSTWLDWRAEDDVAADKSTTRRTADQNTTKLNTTDRRLWQLEPWLGGDPLGRAPAPIALHAAMLALAHWHHRAALYRCSPRQELEFGVRTGPSPALQERLLTARQWSRPAGFPSSNSLTHLPGELRRLLSHSAEVVRSRLHEVTSSLAGWQDIDLPLQPCLRDVWHDHLLLDGPTVTGMIDPWAARTECVVTDLARLLGSLSLSPAQWNTAIAAYAQIRPLSDVELRVLPVFHFSSAVLSLGHWVNRLANQTDPLLVDASTGTLSPTLSPSLARVCARITHYLQRVEECR